MTRRFKTPYALVLAAAGALSACATAPPQSLPPPEPRPAGAIAASDMLADAVYSRLSANPTYYFRHVDVRVDGGVAYLSGFVWSADSLYAARRIARSVPGVTAVVTTELELERNGRSSGATR